MDKEAPAVSIDAHVGSALALGSMALGLASAVFIFLSFVYSAALGVMAIALGFSALLKLGKGQGKYAGMAILGIAFGCLVVLPVFWRQEPGRLRERLSSLSCEDGHGKVAQAIALYASSNGGELPPGIERFKPGSSPSAEKGFSP